MPAKKKKTQETLTNTEVELLFHGLKELMDKEMKASLSFKLGRIMKEVREMVQTFYEVRDSVIKKYGTEQESNPGNFDIDPNKRNEYNTEMLELVQTEVEVNFTKIPMSEFDKIDIKPATVEMIFPIIDE